MAGNLDKKTYSEKLKDPRWQKVRLKIMERDRFQCRGCGDDKMTLAVHHCDYVGNNEPWDYPESLLVTLCEECHTREHSGALYEEIKDFVSELKSNGILLLDISFLMEALAEQSYNRQMLSELTNRIYSSEKNKRLEDLLKLKTFIESIEK